MKKSVVVAFLAVFALALFVGCNTEALKKLAEDNMKLSLDNTTLKAKVDSLEKDKLDLQAKTAVLEAEVHKAKAAAAAAPAAPADDKGGAKKDDKGGAKKDAGKGGAAPKKAKK